jgi:hypothetical protein
VEGNLAEVNPRTPPLGISSSDTSLQGANTSSISTAGECLGHLLSGVGGIRLAKKALSGCARRKLKKYDCPFNGWSCYSVLSCEPPYSRTMGPHFITILFLPTAVATLRTSFLYDAWANWGHDEGRSMRFPSGHNGLCSDESV